MNKKIISEFAKVTAHIKELEVMRDALKEDILKEMSKEGMTKAETDFGVFSIAARTSYEYTDAVAKLKEKVKLAELKEQKTGKAKEKVTEYLYFKAV